MKKKENNLGSVANPICGICEKPIIDVGILTLNPRTGKNEMMHSRCYASYSDKSGKNSKE